MAKVSRRWRLDLYAGPTERRPSSADVAEALYALQVEANDTDVEALANSPFSAPLVGLVKHMARASGSWHAVDLDGSSFMDIEEGPSARRARIEEVMEGA